MLFVDGENFTCRGQEYAKSRDLPLEAGPFYRRDAFLWMPTPNRYDIGRATDPVSASPRGIIGPAIRSYYFTSVMGDELARKEVEGTLWNLGFSPQVFARAKYRGSKGVDIALTKEMLSHAFRGNYDAVALVAGDGDFVPLVEEVKRLGKVVHVWFFNEEHGLSRTLQLAADAFTDLGARFERTWRDHPFTPR
jgi:uncharacterized protein (TIGR00288 family)